MLPKIIANFTTSLSSKLSPGDTSLVVNSIGSKHGDLTDGLYLITLSEGESNEEHILGTLDADTLTFSSLTRDLSVVDGVTSQSTGKIHRRGSEVKITNFLLVQIARALNGDTPLTANAPIRYGSDFAFSNARDLVDKQYVLSVVSGGSVTFDQHVLNGTLGEDATARELVYFKESDQKWWKCDADTASTVESVKLGITLGSGVADGEVAGGILIFGLIQGFSGLTPGAKQYAGNTAGTIVETPGTNDVFLGWAYDSESIIFYPREIAFLTDSFLAALAGGGDFGTPSASNKFVTEEYLVSGTPTPTQTILTPNTPKGGSSTRFDVTNITGNTYRYTFDGTGTDPNINSGTMPIGTVVDIQGQNFAAGNKGLFVTTGVGSNYFEIDNASGVAENDKTIGNGYLLLGGQYTAPANVKYIKVRQVGAGGSGGSASAGANVNVTAPGGASAGYAEKLFTAAELSSPINYVVGYKSTGGSDRHGARTVFASIITNGGQHGTNQANPGTQSFTMAVGGSATGGDVNVDGQNGGMHVIAAGTSSSSYANISGAGASTPLGIGGLPIGGANNSGVQGKAGTGYGSGGSGGNAEDGNNASGGDGGNGVIIIDEYYS